MRTTKILYAMLIFSILLFGTAVNRGNYPQHSQASEVPSSSGEPELRESSLGYTLIIDNTTIDGDIVLGNETRAIIINSVIKNGSYIRLKDDAYLEIRNTVFGDLTIETYGSSSLFIFSTGGQGLLVQGFDSSHVYILNDTYMATIFMYSGYLYVANSTINNTYVAIQNADATFISVDFWYSTVEFHHGSYAEIHDSTSNSVHFRLENNSDLTVNGSNLMINTDIRVTLGSYLLVASSNVSYIYLFHTSYADINGASIDYLYVYDSSYAYVESTTIGTLYVKIAYYGDYFEATADIIDSTVTNAWITTALTVRFSNSHIDSLSYARIYYGTFFINQTDLSYGYMDNGAVLLDGSTAGTISVRSDTFVIRDAGNVYINRSASYYIYNSSNVKIESSTYSLILSNSSATVTIASDMNLKAYNSSVDITSSGNYMYIYASSSIINVTNTQYSDTQITAEGGSTLYIANSELNGTYIYAPSAVVQINNTKMYSVDYLSTPDSRVLLYNSSIYRSATGFSYLHDGLLIVIDSLIDLRIEYDITIEGGTYNIENGIIMLPGPPIPSGIASGIVGIGTVTVNNITIDYVTLTGAVVYFDSYTAPETYTEFRLNGTELHLSNVVLPIGSIYAGGAPVYIYNGDINLVSSDDVLTLAINNTHVGSIYASSLNLNANYSNIDEIDADTAILSFWSSNVSDIDIRFNCHLEGHNLWVDRELSVGVDVIFTGGDSQVDIRIDSGSNISFLTALGYGRVDVLNSFVGQLMYTFADVYLNSSTVQFVLRNYYITDSGSVIVDGNTISGSYELLLHIDPGTIVGYIEDGIVVNSSNPNLDLLVQNSQYMALLAFSGNVTISDSKIDIVIIHNQRAATIINALSNLTMFGDEGPMIAISSPDIKINNYTVLGSIGLFNSSVSVSDLNITLGGLFAMGVEGNVDIIGNPMGMFFLDSNLLISLDNSISSDVSMETSKIDMTGGILGNVQVVDSSFNYSYGDMVRVLIDNSTSRLSNIASSFNITVNSEARVTLIQCNIDTIGIKYTYDPESIDFSRIMIYATETTISKGLLGYKISGGNHIITEAPDMSLTIYSLTGSNIATYYEIRVDIRGSAVVNISDINDIPLRSIIAIIQRDYVKPDIEMLTPSLVEYEFGLHAEIRFVINDENPAYYEVILNFTTTIITESYTPGATIVINLDTIITAPGTTVFKINAYDAFGNMDTTNLTVRALPAEPPSITSAPESTIEMTLGEPIELTWSATDASPAQYLIYINGSLVNSSDWSGESVSFTFNPSEPGTYNITIVFVDQLGQKTSNTVIVRANPSAPSEGGETGGGEEGGETGGEEAGGEEGGTTTSSFSSIVSLVVVMMIILLIVAAILMRKRS